MSRRGRSAALAIATAAALLPAAVVASPAAAHNYLVSSTPAAEENLTQLPEEFSVTTNEPLLDVSGTASGFALQVTDDAGAYYGDGCLTVAGATLSTAASLGLAGTYTLAWQVVSADGHTVDGAFEFTWAPPDGYSPATGTSQPPTCGEAQDEHSPSEPDESQPDAAPAGITGADLLWVLGTVVVVAVVLVGTLVVLTRTKR